MKTHCTSSSIQNLMWVWTTLTFHNCFPVAMLVATAYWSLPSRSAEYKRERSVNNYGPEFQIRHAKYLFIPARFGEITIAHETLSMSQMAIYRQSPGDRDSSESRATRQDTEKHTKPAMRTAQHETADLLRKMRVARNDTESPTGKRYTRCLRSEWQ